jgi:hypothetical protein
VELRDAVPAELIVVRGCTGGCAVDVSTDGATFRAAGSAAAEFGTVPLDGQPITAVRVGVGADRGPSLREISVWGPRTERQAALEPLDAGEQRGLRDPFDGTESDAPGWLIGLAAVLAAAALFAFGIVIGQRRSRSRVVRSAQ